MRSLAKKPHFWPSQRLKKGVVHGARLRKAAHWPNNNLNPSGLYAKISLLSRKARYLAILNEKTPFVAFAEAKKGVVHCARLRKAAHWPNNNAKPSGLSEKKVYCVQKRDMCDP